MFSSLFVPPATAAEWEFSMELIVLKFLGVVIILLVLALTICRVSCVRLVPVVILYMLLAGSYHYEVYSGSTKNEACIQETMADFAGYDDVAVTDRCASRALVEVEEHEDYKTCRIKTKDNHILKFNLFPDYSYQDVEVEK